jgi:hypothetical protein
VPSPGVYLLYRNHRDPVGLYIVVVYFVTTGGMLAECAEQDDR